VPGITEAPAIDPVLVLGLLWVVGFALAAGRYAAMRDRRVVPWMIFGAILGPIALIVIRIAPPGRCGTCRAPTAGWLTICRWCANDVTVDPAAPTTPRVAPVPDTPATVTPLPSTLPTTRPMAAAPPPVPLHLAEPEARPTTLRPVPSVPPPVTATEVDRLTILASGVFVTGTVGLQVGSRFTITNTGSRLRITGPDDQDPTKVAFEWPLADLEATGLNDRLILTQAGHVRRNVVLVFMALAGSTPADCAAAIEEAGVAADVAS
jgi:hypothetical protein